MSDTELQALGAVVQRETAIINANVARYGESLGDPSTPALGLLIDEMHRRGVFGGPTGPTTEQETK